MGFYEGKSDQIGLDVKAADPFRREQNPLRAAAKSFAQTPLLKSMPCPYSSKLASADKAMASARASCRLRFIL